MAVWYPAVFRTEAMLRANSLWLSTIRTRRSMSPFSNATGARRNQSYAPLYTGRKLRETQVLGRSVAGSVPDTAGVWGRLRVRPGLEEVSRPGKVVGGGG